MAQRTPVRSRQGFTLVELLVVIGIIAVLISILLPALNRTRDKARSVQCASQMRQLYMFCAMFAQDNKGHLPRPGINEVVRTDENQAVPATSTTAEALSRTTNWAQFGSGRADFEIGAIWKYVASIPVRKQLVLCPGDNGEQVRYGSIQAVGGSEGRTFSYSMNSNISPSPDSIDKLGISLGAVKAPAEKIMWFEEIGPNDSWCLDPINNGDDTPTGRHGGQRALNALRDQAPGSPGYNFWAKAGRGNHCFFDGHVESLAPNDIFKHPAYWTPLRG
jgi:prepilin-type N-terminal cleavage/methylation domain-containing protein/prepilin-type processing-associated H-X9-DG protein